MRSVLGAPNGTGVQPHAGDAAAAGVAYLKAHPQAVGFEVEPPGLQAANDAAMNGRTVMRAIAARKCRQRDRTREE